LEYHLANKHKEILSEPVKFSGSEAKESDDMKTETGEDLNTEVTAEKNEANVTDGVAQRLFENQIK
jgi:hypothetical protein